MRANQKSLIKDERGNVDIPAVIIIIGISFIVTGSIFVVLDHVLVTPIQEVINIPEDSLWSDSLGFSAIGGFCIILGIVCVVICMMWFRGKSSVQMQQIATID